MHRLVQSSFRRVPRAAISPVLTACTVALACAIAPVLFLRHYQTTFGYDPAIIYLGWLLIACPVLSAYSGLLFLAGVIPASHDEFWTGLFAVLLGVSSSAVGLIYLSAYISNKAWGDSIAYDIAATFVREPKALLEFLPFSAKMKVILACLAGGALTALLCGTSALSRFFARELFLRAARWLRSSPSAGVRARRAVAVFGPLGMTILLLSLMLSILIHQGTWRLVGEPVSSFLKWFPAADTLHMDSYRMRAAFADRSARASYPKAVASAETNVVLILADSMRADHMGVYGYRRETTPFLTSLFRKGVLHRVEMALSTCSESYCGISSTLASHPFHHVSEKSLKLYSLLKDLGYRIYFFLSGNHRSWKYVYDFYGNDVDVFYDYVADNHHSSSDDRNVLAGLEQVASFSGQPGFFYFFLMSSHVSGVRYPEYERFRPNEFEGIEGLWNEVAGTRRVDDKVTESKGVEGPELSIFANHYDNGVLQADAMIRNIFAMLDAKGYLENGVVFILADHGDGLGEHGHLGHTRYLYQEDIRIPFLIYDPDSSVSWNRRFGTQIDVAPSVMDRLGLPIPSSWEGKSLLRAAGERVTLHQTRRGANLCRAVVSDRAGALFKYIRCGSVPGEGSEELYELNADPREQRNLLARGRPQVAEELRRELDSRFSVTTNRCDSMECVD